MDQFSYQLPRAAKFKATLCVAEMYSFMAELKSRCDILTAEKLGQTVAQELCKMAGHPASMTMNCLAECLQGFCAELFVWFESDPT
jgi:hypothetical protein